jgi:hypothetical protein
MLADFFFWYESLFKNKSIINLPIQTEAKFTILMRLCITKNFNKQHFKNKSSLYRMMLKLHYLFRREVLMFIHIFCNFTKIYSGNCEKHYLLDSICVVHAPGLLEELDQVLAGEYLLDSICVVHAPGLPEVLLQVLAGEYLLDSICVVHAPGLPEVLDQVLAGKYLLDSICVVHTPGLPEVLDQVLAGEYLLDSICVVHAPGLP